MSAPSVSDCVHRRISASWWECDECGKRFGPAPSEASMGGLIDPALVAVNYGNGNMRYFTLERVAELSRLFKVASDDGFRELTRAWAESSPPTYSRRSINSKTVVKREGASAESLHMNREK